MRAQLIQYVDLLFAGTKDCEDIHQEILQNTLDRYDDLILEGKSPEAAYRLAILSIGDINEVLGTQTVASSPIVAEKTAKPRQKKWVPIVIGIVIAVLVLPIGVLGLNVFAVKRSADRYPAATHVPERIEPTEAQIYMESTFYAGQNINIRKKPSSMAEVVGMVEAGDTVHLTREEIINGQHWGYIEEPENGWIFLDAFTDEAIPTETTAAEPVTTEPVVADIPNSASGNGYGTEAAGISQLTVEWAAGDIQIVPIDGTRIQITETGDYEEYPMVIKNKNGKLTVSYSEAKSLIGIHSVIGKDLVVELPKDLILKELEIDAAAATVTVKDLSFREVEFKGASGKCDFVNCNVDSLDVEAASGDVSYLGTLKALDCEAVSASFYGTLTNVPKKIEMESMSGNLDLTLPENAGFTVNMEGMSKDFTTDFDTNCNSSHHHENHSHSSCNEKVHTHGDGACRISVEAVSGNVNIHKAK